jgi:hypothetical protein
MLSRKPLMVETTSLRLRIDDDIRANERALLRDLYPYRKRSGPMAGPSEWLSEPEAVATGSALTNHTAKASLVGTVSRDCVVAPEKVVVACCRLKLLAEPEAGSDRVCVDQSHR